MRHLSHPSVLPISDFGIVTQRQSSCISLLYTGNSTPTLAVVPGATVPYCSNTSYLTLAMPLARNKELVG